MANRKHYMNNYVDRTPPPITLKTYHLEGERVARLRALWVGQSSMRVAPSVDVFAIKVAVAAEAKRWGDLAWAFEHALSGRRKELDGSYRAGEHGDSGQGGAYVSAGRTIEQVTWEAINTLCDAGIEIEGISRRTIAV